MTRTQWIIGGIVAGCLLLAGVGGYQVYRQSQVSAGQALFNEGNYAGVIEYYAPLLEGGGGLPDERVLLAESLYRLRRYEEAETVLQPILEFGNEDSRSVFLAGWIALEQDNIIVAEDRFEKLASLGEPELANAGRAAALLQRSEGYRRDEISEARFLVNGVLTERPDSVYVQLTAAEFFLIEHNYEAAIEAARTAVSLAPEWSQPYTVLGRAHLLSGQVEEAETAFQNGLERGGSQQETRYYLARSVYLQGRLGDAVDLLDAISEQDSPFARVALEDAARIDIARGNLAASAERLRQALSIQEIPSTGMQLYHVLVRMGNDVEAAQLLDTILASRPFISDARLERAHLYYESGEVRRAENEYQTVRDNDPDNALASYNLGTLALGSDMARRAPELLDLALTGYPDYLPATVNHALSLVDTGQIINAGSILQPLIESHPDVQSVQIAYALERFASGETEAAIQWLQDTPDETPSAEKALLRGELFLRLYLNERAGEEFALAMERDEHSQRARVDYAHSLIRQGMSTEAEAVYTALMEGESLPDSLSVQVRNARALLLMEEGQPVEATRLWDALKSESDTARRLAQLNELLSRSGRLRAADLNRLGELAREPGALPETHYNLAWAYRQNGQALEAIAAYETLLVDYPRFLPGLLNLSELYIDQRRFREAVPVSMRARRVAPERTDIQTNAAAVMVKAGNLDDALDEMTDVLERNPEDPQSIYNMALLALRLQDMDLAATQVESLTELTGTDERVWLLEGLMDALQDDLRTAEQAFRQARSLNTDNAFAALNHGVSLARLERTDRALEALQEAVAIDSELAPAYRALGLLLAERGRYSDAVRLLNVSLTYDPGQNELLETIRQIQGWLSQEAR